MRRLTGLWVVSNFGLKTEGLDFGDLNGVQIQPGAKTHEYGY